MTDLFFMNRALELARRGEGWTSPNPMVGAVIVKEGRIVGEGFHQKAGTPHAEVHALSRAGDRAKGATVYVTLEPCCHYGRTPPCADALIQAEVARVVVAMEDPNLEVAGGGIKRLRAAGIQVETGVMEEEARCLNEVFIKHIITRMPFVAVKSALTLDGKIATRTGSSKWITGEKARESARRLRHKYDAIMVGIGTVLSDDPLLTTRIPGLKNPVRVVIDSSLRTPAGARILDLKSASTLIYCASRDVQKEKALREAGGEIAVYPDLKGRVDLAAVLQDLYGRGVTSVLVEGGAGINGTLFDRRLIDKIYQFIAPKMVGSHLAPGMFQGRGISEMKEALMIEHLSVEKVGDDLLITGYPKE